MELLILLAIIIGIVCLVGASRKAPESLVAKPADYAENIASSTREGKTDRTVALLQALPNWDIRNDLIDAARSLSRLKNGITCGRAVGLSDYLLEPINQRTTEGQEAVRRVAVKVSALRSHTQASEYVALSLAAQAALNEDDEARFGSC